MKRLLALLFVFLACFDLHAKEKAQLVSRVPMEYPYEARKRGMEGSGWFVLQVDRATGHVTSVKVALSTGHRLLDQAAVRNFRQFRFAPNGPPQVKMPASYKLDR